ncbi:MAG: DOMON-like domain-containing protein [Pseudomonadota bacterium]
MDNMLRMQPHSDNTAHSVDGFDVGFSLDHKGRLWLRYHVDCDLERLVLPNSGMERNRADNLWKTTCFEAFIRLAGASDYLELNLSPSGQWAAYVFESYRKGMTNEEAITASEIGLDASASHFALEATVQLPERFIGASTDLAITAVLHEEQGAQSFWSLTHPPGKPDFHHDTCFALKLAPPIIP